MIGLHDPSRSTGNWDESRGSLALGVLGCLLLILMTAGSPAQAQTTIEMEHFGVGNAYRPGGPVAIRVTIKSDEDEAVPGIIQWELPNPDGDIATNVRRIAIPARGGRTTTWLLGDLPSTASPMDLGREPWFIRLFEYRDGRRTKEIATTRINPSLSQAKAVQQRESMSMVIGGNPAGLDAYGPMPGGNRPGLNEEMITVFGVEPGDLPDTWLGLAPYELIVWAANAPNYSPSIIGNKPSTERALREWVERGGHLVILLPSSGDPWRIGREETVFGELLGGLEPIRKSDYPLREALPALSDRAELQNPDATMTLHHFDPDTLAAPWRPLAGFRPYAPPFDEESVEIPEDTPLAGRQILVERAREAWPYPASPIIHAVRRDVGMGTLDVVGIDVCDPDLRIQQSSLLPKAWVFWNPLLGRSSFTGTGELFRKIDEENRLLSRSESDFLGRGLVSPLIAISAAAASGILVALVLFVIYWLLAGPLGFSILSRMGFRRHAWVLFTVMGGIFAVIAWMLGLLSVGGGRDLKHLTVLTDIYRVGDDAPLTDFDRATCWFSTRLPGYGLTRVTVGEGDQADALSYFSPPPPASSSPFPNASRYDVPFEEQGSYEVPARATSAEFVANWKGNPLETNGIWKTTIKVDLNRPVTATHTTAGGLQVDGVLVNTCGTDLTDVTLILTLSRRPPMLKLGPLDLPVLANTAITGMPPNIGVAITLPLWRAGESIDLRTEFNTPRPVPSYGRNSFRSELEQMFPPPSGAIAGLIDSPLNDADRRKNLTALSIYGILPDPRILYAPGSTASSWRFIRQIGRSIDISSRTSEATLMALGFAKDVPCPVPIVIDGEDRTGSGDVMLQWVHPLPVDVEALVPLRDDRFDPKVDKTAETDGDPA